jgi:iron(III) transport system substrate-binding protein
MGELGAQSELTRRELLQWSLLSSIGVTLAACVGSPSSTPSGRAASPNAGLSALIAKAKDEKQVTYYNLGGEINDRWIAGFQAAYGIEVQNIKLSTVVMSQRFTVEQQAGKVVADVINNTDYAFYDSAVSRGWIAPIDPPAAKGWPAEYWRNSVATWAIGKLSIDFNTQLVPSGSVPAQWKDLLNPRWKGKILMVDPRAVPLYRNMFALLRSTYGDSFLKGLAAQNLQLTASGIPGAAKLAAGDVAIMFPSSHWNITPLISKGAPLESTNPTPTSGSEQLAAVAQGAPHPNAATLFLNYGLSAEGQAAICRKLCASALPNVPEAVPLPRDYIPTRKLPQPSAAEQTEMWGLLGLK